MEYAVRKFARNVLLLHLLLLGIVLAVVLFASKSIRNSAREQAQQQADARQRTLAAQTSRGVEAYYQSILSSMNLGSRQEDSPLDREAGSVVARELGREMVFPLIGSIRPTPAPTTTAPVPQLPPSQQSGVHINPQHGDAGRPETGRPETGRPDAGRPDGIRPELGRLDGGRGANRPAVGRTPLLPQLLKRQLEERVTHLFVVSVPKDPKHSLSIKSVTKTVAVGEGPDPETIITRYEGWLRSVKEQAVSQFELFDGKGCNLVVLPIGRGQDLVVAVVPVAAVAEQYLSSLGQDAGSCALLVDDASKIMAGTGPSLVGVTLSAIADPDARAALASLRTAGHKQTRTINHPFTIGGDTFQASLLSAEPIDIAGRHWFVIVGSPLEEIDTLVGRIFDPIVIWAIIVVVVVTAILLSTSLQLIRGRLRSERIRMTTLQKELDRARQIQQAWLPRNAPSSRNVDVAAVNFPANHISGDFYNWFELPDGRTAVAIGDVTGHGMSAAFLMATTQLLIRTTMQQLVTNPARALEAVNRQLCTLIFNGQFVTLQVLAIDPETGTIEIASAGHPPPLLGNAAGIAPVDADSGLVLGVDAETVYETHTVDIGSVDTLLLYTDGASDLQSPSGERLGAAGLLELCPVHDDRQNKSRSAQTVIDTLVSGITHFRGNRELGDDLTFVAIRVAQPLKRHEPELVAVG